MEGFSLRYIMDISEIRWYSDIRKHMIDAWNSENYYTHSRRDEKMRTNKIKKCHLQHQHEIIRKNNSKCILQRYNDAGLPVGNYWKLMSIVATVIYILSIFIFIVRICHCYL